MELKLFRKICDITKSVLYISISCNFIIKNYVNLKITSYIYLWIFTKSRCFHVKHSTALTKIIIPLSTQQPLSATNTQKYDSNGDKNEKSTCMHKKSIDQSCKALNYTHPPSKIQIKYVFYENKCNLE